MMRMTMSWLIIVPLILMTACTGMRRTARAKADAQAKIAMAEHEIGIAKQADADTYSPQRLLEATESFNAAKRKFEAKTYDGAWNSAQAAILSARGAAQLAQEAKKKKEQLIAEEKKAKEDAKKKEPPAGKAKAKAPVVRPKPKI